MSHLANVAADQVIAVIVAYRSGDELVDCVSALLQAGVRRIVLVDNNDANEQNVTVAKLADDPAVRVVVPGGNVGFAAGVNAGAAVALELGASLLWFVNPDTVVDARAANQLAETLLAGDADLVSPLLTTGSPTAERILFAGGNLDMTRGLSTHADEGKPVTAAPTGLLPCTFITGAAPMIAAAAWQALGGFREDYFLYWEDAELSYRARQAGLRLAVVGAARAWHAVGGSSAISAGHSRAAHYYYSRNRLLFARDSAHLLGWLLGRGLPYTVADLIWTLRREPTERFGKFRAAFCGVFDGLRNVRGAARGLSYLHADNAKSQPAASS
ncbi:MAG: glycosyltransferase family 2 protein [Propionibacteriaceae bacterium]|jgi:GT2 family glycosyltransferase|nr:glycosyltransferase family 2 protein [Propionibacteriaceae bacterium]